MTALAYGQSGRFQRYSPAPAQGELANVIELAERRAREATFRNRPVPPPFDCLEEGVGRAVSQQWQEACEAAFEFLLQRSPGQLARLIDAQVLRPGDLTFAAEILGRCADGNLVRSTLSPLLRHPDAAVREGAIYGVAGHLDAELIAELARMAKSDSSAAVRSAAEDARGL